MAGVNKLILVGRLGKDPELRNLDNGQKVANFSVATSETWKDKTTGEKKESTEWHNIVIWGALGETAAKYLHKGDQVYLEGKLRTRSWEKDGVTRYVAEMFADQMVMLTPKSASSTGASAAAPPPVEQKGAPQKSAFDTSSDDLPF